MQAQVIINEFSASNLAHLPLSGQPGSFYGSTNFHDWIELRNLGSEAIDLGGWHLSDQASNPTRFVIPAGTMLEPGGHRLFVCSGYGLEGDGLNTAVDAYGHVNTYFKLKQSPGTEAVVLADPEGSIVDVVALTQVTAPDHSWARYPDGVGPWMVQTAPTPNAANQAEGAVGYMPGELSQPMASKLQNS